MTVLRPILSFVLSTILAACLTVFLRRPQLDIPGVALATWLFVANLVHAVNSLIWASDLVGHVPVWCDIVTNLLLGAAVALPSACVSSARAVELLSSQRKIYPNTYSRRIHLLIDVALCFVLPLLYMTLHFAVQEHRFDLVRSLGCSASVQRSTPAMLVMILPPAFLGITALALCVWTAWTCCRMPAGRFAAHLAARSAVSAPRFIRRLSACTLLTLTVLIFSFLPLLDPHPDSWASFQADFSTILIVEQDNEIVAAHRTWWAIPSISTMYILLVLLLGDLGTDTFTWFRSRLGPTPLSRPARPELSRLTFNQSTHDMAMVSKTSLATPTAPQAVQLRSGWDDMLDVKRSRRGGFAGSNRKSVASCSDPETGKASPSTSGSASPTTPDDDAFTASTLTYLASPVAQALGLPSPVSRHEKLISPVSTFIPNETPRTPRPGPKTLHLAPPRQPIPEDTASTISSIWDAPWPLPPVSPSSPRSAWHAYPMHSPVEPLYVPKGPPASAAPPRRTRNIPLKPALKVPRREHDAADVIYMTGP
ncbi:pheromone A receptor-domain-containing protein [Mycena belliarum]|uniref:Pheromone A receptor-domain-containing protein n=1 Tax=Mycena belliarum TaxID=1033014 RepID=A0AAD6U4G9_9AGAR|nr:pheromone A receptor-domain-containing protein [Mycena belliae]